MGLRRKDTPMPVSMSLGRPQIPPSADVADVVAAADALGVREFRLFTIAYARWFGRAASDAVIERPFMRYLYTAEAPLWVRQFTREVLRLRDVGRLDPTRYGLPPTRPLSPVLADVEAASRIALVVVWGIIIIIVGIGVI